MESPKVSFLIAVFNGEEFVEECIDSCLNQTYRNVEICVTDDGSQDRTLQILRERYGNDERVIIDSFAHNQGKVAAYNCCYANATGDLLLVFGADDVNYLDRLEESVAYMQAKGGDLLVGGYDIVDEGLGPLGVFAVQALDKPALRVRIIENNIAAGGAMMFRRNVAQVAFPIPSELAFEDWWIVFCAIYCPEDLKVDFCQRSLFKYRQHGKNTIGADNGNLKRDYKRHFAYYQQFRRRLREWGDEGNVPRVGRVEVFKAMVTEDGLAKRLALLARCCSRLDKYAVKGILVFFLRGHFKYPQTLVWRLKQRLRAAQ